MASRIDHDKKGIALLKKARTFCPRVVDDHEMMKLIAMTLWDLAVVRLPLYVELADAVRGYIAAVNGADQVAYGPATRRLNNALDALEGETNHDTP